MKVMIVGSSGQVGRCLVQQLSGKVKLFALGHKDLDITHQQAVLECVAKFKPDFIINAAAHTAVDKAEVEVEESYAVNSDGPKFLAEAAQLYEAVIIHISTDYVFDGEADQPYTESDETFPQGVYGRSKLAGEKAVASVCNKHLILRTSWIFSEHGNNFVKTMLRLAESRNELAVVDDQFGGPTYAGDIANTIAKMIYKVYSGNKVEWGIYHFSGMPYVSWFSFADRIFSVAKEEGLIEEKPKLISIPTSKFCRPAKRPANSCLDCNKIYKHFDVQPSDWRKALKNIKYYK